jgi:hypothetical protein
MSKNISDQNRKRTPDSSAREKIGVTALKGVSVLFEDDIYDLANWLLKVNEAKDKGTDHRSRRTVYGLAGAYSQAADIGRDQIIRVLEVHGLPLGATVEYDDDVV